MPGKVKYPVFIVYVILIFLFQDLTVLAQQQPMIDKKVSFSFSNMPLANVLRSIGNKTGVKFSYNPEIIPSGRIINMKFTNQPLRDVLKVLVNDPTITIREIGNQIVLYRGDPSQIPLEPNQQLIQGKPKILVPAKNIPDTVFVYQLDTLIINHYDTVFRSVSITRFDTIRITDTVFFEKSKPAQKTGKEIQVNNNNTSPKTEKKQPENSFYTGFYFEMLPGATSYKNSGSETEAFVSLVNQTNSGKSTKFSAGVIAGFDYHKLGIRSGIGFTRLGENFDYAYSIVAGGFYHTYVVDTNYTLEGGNLIPHYVTDSSWIPQEVKNYSYRNPNSFKYLEIPLSVKVRFWHNEKAELYALGGVNAAFLLEVDALQINAENTNEVLPSQKRNLNPVLFTWHAGIGSAFKLSSRTGLLAEAVIRKQTNSQFKEGQPEKQYTLLGLKIAAYYKF